MAYLNQWQLWLYLFDILVRYCVSVTVFFYHQVEVSPKVQSWHIQGLHLLSVEEGAQECREHPTPQDTYSSCQDPQEP